MKKMHLAKMNDRPTYGSSRFFIGLVMLAGVLLLAVGPALTKGAADARSLRQSSQGACSATTNALLKACQHSATDAYFVAIANCNNLSDTQAIPGCKQEARAAFEKDDDLCDAQAVARAQLCQAFGEAPYDPVIDPANFVDPREIGRSIQPNPFLLLIPGRSLSYRSPSETVKVTVTGKTRVIDGVTCAVIRDVVKNSNGEVIEDTIDWFAQDVNGNVWNFGEESKDFEGGVLVSIDGSFRAGVDNAKPGIQMPGPGAVVGQIDRQEFSLANAEDIGRVLSLTGSATVPAARCNHTCRIIQDTTPIEPDLLENKYYAPGVGFILQVTPATGERLELVGISN
jgi:hypothetical protein